MADAQMCWRLADECERLATTDVDPRVATVLQAMAVSWKRLGGQMERLNDADPHIATHISLKGGPPGEVNL